MKVQRTLYIAAVSLKHFYSRNFSFDNFNFVDLSKSLLPHEKDEFALTERVFANQTLYEASYKLTLRVIFHETPADEELARKRYPYIYVFVRTMQGIVFFTALKIVYKLLLTLFWSAN